MTDFKDDTAALRELSRAGVRVSRQRTIIIPKGQELQQKVLDAINYLCNNWEYDSTVLEYKK